MGKPLTSEELNEMNGMVIDCETEQYETEVIRTGVRKGMIAFVCAICIMTIAEILTGHRIDFGKVAVVFLVSGIMNLTEGKKLNNRKTLNKGILELVCTVLFFTLYIGELVLL